MKFLYFSILSMFCFFVTAQNKSTKINPSQTTSVTYQSYRHLKTDPTRKIDSVGFKLHKNDTLIFITGYKKRVDVPYESKDSAFLAVYKEIVFNKSYQKSNTSKPTIKIWKEEIKVYFDSTVSYSKRRELTKFFKFLDKEVDSLKISIVRKKEKSNYFIYFINKPTDINWEDRINGNDGYYISWDGKQRIFNATLKLDTQKVFNDQQQLTILKKNFISTLGNFYFQNNNTDCKSIFSNCFTNDKELTEGDVELLKYHYSYGICKGTDLNTFEENHSKAQEMLDKDPNAKIVFTHED